MFSQTNTMIRNVFLCTRYDKAEGIRGMYPALAEPFLVVRRDPMIRRKRPDWRDPSFFDALSYGERREEGGDGVFVVKAWRAW